MTIKKPEDKLRRFAATYLTQKDMAHAARAPYLFGFFTNYDHLLLASNQKIHQHQLVLFLVCWHCQDCESGV